MNAKKWNFKIYNLKLEIYKINLILKKPLMTGKVWKIIKLKSLFKNKIMKMKI